MPGKRPSSKTAPPPEPPLQSIQVTQSERAVIMAMRRLSDHQRDLITRTVMALVMTDEQRLAIIASFAENTVIELSRDQGGQA